MDERSNSFGYWLRRRRKALDLTQGALAEKVSCSPAAIKKIEAEERRPSRALALRLAEHLAVPAHERAGFLEAARRAPAAQQPQLEGLQPRDTPNAEAGQALAPPGESRLPFVGRDNEYGLLLGLIAGLTARCGQLVLIQGEAGIGKSRLLHEMALYAQQRSLPALVANCFEIERAIAYQPIIDLATQACQAMPDSQLRTIAPILLAEIAALVPAMAARLPDLPPLSADFPEARQARLFHALVQLFDALARNRQLILAIDNIQWADDASLRFLHFFARQIASRPMLLAWACRDDELDSNEHLAGLLESLRREPHARVMPLARLQPADTDALLQRTGDPKLSGSDLAARLHRESEGNPFFLWSIVHSLSEGEAGAGEAFSTLPDDLRDSVRARLARVTPEERHLLDVAAVLGRRFDFETLLALTQAPEDRFLQSIESLVKRRLLREEQEGGLYDFSHDKVREVVYRDIGTARRVLLHRVVAELLEQHASSQAHERNAHLAEHYERGKVWPKAVHYLRLAADRSQKLFAIGEALQWFDRAIALLQAHPEAAAPAQQLALYESRGVARAQAGQIEGAVTDFQRVIDAARAQGEHEHARDVLIQLGMAYRRADAYQKAVDCLNEALSVSRATGDERHVADTLYHLGTVFWSNGRNDLAISYHQQAVDICERLGLTDLVAVQAFHGRGEAYFAHAEPDAAIRAFSRSLDLARGIGDRSYESENLMMIGWALTGHMGLADYPRALSHFDKALEIARAADLQWHLGPTLIGRAHARTALGRCDEAWTDLNEALPRLRALGLVRYQMMAHDALGCLLLDLNLVEEAAQHFQQGLRLAQGAAINYWLPRLQANLAIAQVRAGRPCDLAALRSSCQYAQDHSETWLTSRCLEALGESALAAGDAQGCRAYADQLLALACGADMRELAAQARRLLGLAWLAAGEHEPARQELTLALALAEQIGHIRLAWACRGGLARVAAAAGQPSHESAHQAAARELAAQLSHHLRGSGLAFRGGDACA